MEIFSTVGGVLAIIAMSGIPFVVMNRRHNNKKLKSLYNLRALANESGADIVHHDMWNDNSIGLDPQLKKLFFISNVQFKEVNTIIDLQDASKCYLLNTSRSEKTIKGSQKIIDKVDICISPRNKKRPDIFITFYNILNDGRILSGEIQLAEKWIKIINAEIENTN
jgi:hypothetical protein